MGAVIVTDRVVNTAVLQVLQYFFSKVLHTVLHGPYYCNTFSWTDSHLIHDLLGQPKS